MNGSIFQTKALLARIVSTKQENFSGSIDLVFETNFCPRRKQIYIGGASIIIILLRNKSKNGKKL